jgi:hypothetical protein
MANYNFVQIAIALLVLYAASWLLARHGRHHTEMRHRRIWNAVLLVSFIGTIVFSIANAVLFDTGIRLLPFIDVGFWHVEFGIICMIVALFHAAWHIPYFLQYLPKKKAPSSPARAGGEQSRQDATQLSPARAGGEQSRQDATQLSPARAGGEQSRQGATQLSPARAGGEQSRQGATQLQGEKPPA